MRRSHWALVLFTAAAIVAAPAPARADGYVSPFIGLNFATDIGNSRASVGFDAGWMGAGIAGAEFDFAYTPNFFGTEGGFGDNHVLTAMGNLIVGVPVGGTRGSGLRPYGTLGVGVVQTFVTGSAGPGGRSHVEDHDFGLNGGVGVMGFLSNHVGLRGDVRYFRNFREEPKNTLQFGAFHFWRASLGVVLRP